MKYGIYSYEERLKNPHLPLIDFEYLINHPEYINYVWEKYLMDINFQNKVNEKLFYDENFKNRFNSIFNNYLNKEKSR